MPKLKEKKSLVLIIAEEPDMVKLTKKFLALGELKPIMTTSPREALGILEERYKEISMILLDILIPNRSGYHLLEEIKSIKKYKDIRFVLFTDKRFREELQKGKGRVENGYFIKSSDNINSINAEESEYTPYCKYCGGVLTKKDFICQVCGNKVT